VGRDDLEAAGVRTTAMLRCEPMDSNAVSGSFGPAALQRIAEVPKWIATGPRRVSRPNFSPQPERSADQRFGARECDLGLPGFRIAVNRPGFVSARTRQGGRSISRNAYCCVVGATLTERSLLHPHPQPWRHLNG
jgi:hypothetical protein